METMGERLERARRRRLMTQAELAGAAGVSVITVIRLEGQDAPRQPRPSTIRQLASVLGVDPGWLLFGEEDEMGKAAA